MAGQRAQREATSVKGATERVATRRNGEGEKKTSGTQQDIHTNTTTRTDQRSIVQLKMKELNSPAL